MWLIEMRTDGELQGWLCMVLPLGGIGARCNKIRTRINPPGLNQAGVFDDHASKKHCRMEWTTGVGQEESLSPWYRMCRARPRSRK